MTKRIVWVLILFFVAASVHADDACMVFKRLLKAEVVMAKQTKEGQKVGQAVEALDGAGVLDRVLSRFLKEMKVSVKSSTTTDDDSYVCETCDYIYDSDDGCPEQDIKAGTPFKALPSYWVCPVCECGKCSFKKLVD